MIPDGIYLNLPEDTYRTDPALGSTDLKEIGANVVQWHGRRRNKIAAEALGFSDDDEEKNRKVGIRFGRALHTMLLDGLDAFSAKYCEEPERPYLPKTKDEIGAALREAGVPVPRDTSRREIFVAEAKLAGIKTSDDWEDERDLLLAGREGISRRWAVFITMTHRVLELHTRAQRFLTGGRAEVSVFWTDASGLRQKCRFDYLHPRPLVDLKTFANREGREIVANFVSQAEGLAYDMQAAHYMDARINHLPRLVEEGRVYEGSPAKVVAATAESRDALVDGVLAVPASAEDVAFLQRVAAEKSPRWVWVTVLTGGVPEVDVIEMPPGLLVFEAAKTQVDEARQKYRMMRERFGHDDDQLWFEDRGLIRLTEHSFNGYRAINRNAITWERAE